MSDPARHAIPSRLDDPERCCSGPWTRRRRLLGPAVLGLAANAFVTGLVAGLGAWALLRRAKRGGGADVAICALYWHLPGFTLGLKGAPPSHVRRFIG